MALLHPTHLMLVALVVLLVFGPKKLPELARGVGDAMKELQRSLNGDAAVKSHATATVAGSASSVTGADISPTPSAGGATAAAAGGPTQEEQQ